MSAAFSNVRRRIALAAAAALLPTVGQAQDRLIGTSALGAGVTADVIDRKSVV